MDRPQSIGQAYRIMIQMEATIEQQKQQIAELRDGNEYILVRELRAENETLKTRAAEDDSDIDALEVKIARLEGEIEQLNHENADKSQLLASFLSQIEALRNIDKALSIIMDSCLDHHTPHMACIPWTEWNKAMKLIPEPPA